MNVFSELLRLKLSLDEEVGFSDEVKNVIDTKISNLVDDLVEDAEEEDLDNVVLEQLYKITPARTTISAEVRS